MGYQDLLREDNAMMGNEKRHENPPQYRVEANGAFGWQPVDLPVINHKDLAEKLALRWARRHAVATRVQPLGVLESFEVTP